MRPQRRATCRRPGRTRPGRRDRHRRIAPAATRRLTTFSLRDAAATGGGITFEAPAGDITLRSGTGKVTVEAAEDVDVRSATGRVAVTGTAGIGLDAEPGDLRVDAEKVAVHATQMDVTA